MPKNLDTPDTYPETPDPSPLSYEDMCTVRRKFSYYDREKLVIREIRSPLFCDVDEVTVVSRSLHDMVMTRSYC